MRLSSVLKRQVISFLVPFSWIAAPHGEEIAGGASAAYAVRADR